ncbi:MAG: glycosyltransferase [Flavobacteriales bacterium]|nr:glycosyltransferase [Flavobacteriales bacterium]
MISKKKILIAPLDWGLGHAARCVPIIQDLQKDHEIILAGAGRLKSFLTQAFPKLQFIDFEGYNISYPDKGSMAVKMMLQMPKVLARIREEHKELQTLIKQYQIDLVISDNRFGLYSDLVPCIYISHQIHIQAPGMLEDQLFKLHSKYINRFSQCWIPDHEGTPNLAGELSHGNLLKNCIHIGPLSRLKKVASEKTYDYCTLIPGPEPQRTRFEELIVNAFSNRAETLLVLSGKPEVKSTSENHNITIISHLDDEEMSKALCASSIVISRPGYSSIMDLAALEANCIFIPTPGQTEQKYLAEYHLKENGIPFLKQKEISSENIKRLTPNSINMENHQISYLNLINDAWFSL